MIDYDFEERLHRRLDARQAIAGLSQRERGVLAALYRHSDKLEVVAFERGVSRGRIGQIRDKAIRRLRYRLQPPRRPTPLTPKPAPQPAFDKAAFLAHMRHLIAERKWAETHKQGWAWERELSTLRGQIRSEAERQQWMRQREAERVAGVERQERERAERRAQWEAYQAALPELERQRREEATRRHEAARARQLAFEDELRAGIMPAWNAVVARNGWSEGEAQTHWHEWLTGPPGWFG